MHDTALEFGKMFFDTYIDKAENLVIVDVGAQDVNGSLRSVAPINNQYIGVDFAEGAGVDLVINDPYSLPFEDNSVDVCVCSSCFEHSDFFWLLFNEIQRILHPSGIFYLNIPSNGNFHRFPVDCWRFYPDSGIALQNWARRSGYGTVLLESFIGKQKDDVWNDFVAVFLKDKSYISKYPYRIQNTFKNYTNGLTFESIGFSNFAERQEDQIKSFSFCKLDRCGVWMSEVYSQGAQSDLYWRTAKSTDFNENQVLRISHKFHEHCQMFQFTFPMEAAAITGLRLDITNRPAISILHTLRIINDQSNVIWEWDKKERIFSSASSDCYLCRDYDASGDILIISTGFDPYVYLNLPEELLTQIAGGWQIDIGLTIQTPQIGLPVVVQNHAQQIVKREELSKQLASSDLALAQVNEKTAQQSAEIAMLRQQYRRCHEDILRAEAQLELLKDLLVDSDGELERL